MTALDSWQALNLTTGALEYDTPAGVPSDPNTWVYRMAPAQGTGYGLVYAPDLPSSTDFRGYSAFYASTGKLAWISEGTDYPWGGFWAYMPQACAYGMIYGLGYTGVTAFNATNGKIVWHYIDYDTYREEPYSSNIAPNGSTYASYAFGSTGPVIGGGVVYAPNTEHSPTFYYRGQGLCAVDAYTGKELWKIAGIYVPTAIAYGVLLASDSTNGYTYAFSKGETATTVSAQNDVLTEGSSVLLKGTVLDMSPAQPGTAAISDSSMTPWMEYLHMQQTKPNNATGVKMHLTAIDPNNNFQDIGTVVSDIDGTYAIGWTPPVPGVYKVTATFEGSESYYSSTGTTHFLVGEAPSAAVVTPTPATTATPAIPTQTPSQTTSPSTSPSEAPPPASADMTTVYIAIAAAVVIIAVVAAAVILRRRK